METGIQVLQYILGVPFVLFVIGIVVFSSLRNIGQTEVGLVSKRFAFKKLKDDNPIAFSGEAGYQADLLMPGLRWKLWPIFKVEKFPWVQVPAGEIGVVIAQVGKALPIGAKSAVYKTLFGNFADLRTFTREGGQKGIQRPVLSPGSLAPIHPVGFLVVTKNKVYGLPVDPDLQKRASGGRLTVESFGLTPKQLELTRIEPKSRVEGGGEIVDMVGIVTTYEGEPLPSGTIAGRLEEFRDIAEMERTNQSDSEVIELLLGSKNNIHNNYQDFQAFLDGGGKIGLQHDTLLYGAYALNPFLVSVELVPMLVVRQGEVAVIKAYVGLATEDTSGAEFKFGSIVKPGHRGIWRESLRTGKYPINPRCYQGEIVPTSILTLNWADATSKAHSLDTQLKQIDAKSCEGFEFAIDLQVQIHVPDTKAPRVISMVGTMQNLVNEVLQAAVGNYFRDKLQSMAAVKFIQTRQDVQGEAYTYIKSKLSDYHVETPGAYIQDVVLPKELVAVLTQREIANQEVATYKKQQEAQQERIAMEKTKGTAEMQAELAQSEVRISIKENDAKARIAEAAGEAEYLQKTAAAEGIGKAEGYEKQRDALGEGEVVALVNIMSALAEKRIDIVPQVQVTGNGDGGGIMNGLVALVMNQLVKDRPDPRAPKGPAPKTEVNT